ncbi:calcium/sodium antiporter [Anaerorhabdus sp.]|uniref:calcium/sodium antiporter n=1 Tax=Anaerorhabdus sp. TaxID=1872524 RepID=UPI002B1F7F7A|nr:calcium/sodium antiporter [Anaerorhabdus sp.]MEA4873966.1 calcium/sodium antiporter [Anaerorhabdus sp.]
MIVNIGLLLVGFLALIKGADYFVDGAASIASLLKIPSVVVGLTIVAFGTSAPEAAVSITAALNHSNAIAISNVIGSNIFNLIVVLGMTAIITIIPVPRSIMRKEFPFLIAVSFLMALFIFTGNSLTRLEGIIFLILIIAYVVWLIKDSLSKRASIEVEKPMFSLPMSLVLIVIGIFGIIFGGDLVVNNAKAIALTLGLSEKLVGLTIVSIGTSLPELVTSLVAAKKGNVDIAVGNVVGSNIFNILFILGLSATITPIPVEFALMFDLVIMLIATLLCFFVAKRNGKLGKKEGIIFLLLFISYLTYIIIRN